MYEVGACLLWDSAGVSADLAAAAPSGVVTFLFTDVEGSTRRWETDADLMRKALVPHDEVLHTAIEKHDGFVFKHTGDGVCAAFASPRSAVDAAIAAQRALELPVRMGIATGEAELREGDYFGLRRCTARLVVRLLRRSPRTPTSAARRPCGCGRVSTTSASRPAISHGLLQAVRKKDRPAPQIRPRLERAAHGKAGIAAGTGQFILSAQTGPTVGC
jgi:hypothetical protein